MTTERDLMRAGYPPSAEELLRRSWQSSPDVCAWVRNSLKAEIDGLHRRVTEGERRRYDDGRYADAARWIANVMTESALAFEHALQRVPQQRPHAKRKD